MADSPYLARMRQRKIDMEAKLVRLNAMPDAPESAKTFTKNGIDQLDAEIKRLSQSPPIK